MLQLLLVLAKLKESTIQVKIETMQIAIDIPDEYIQKLEPNLDSLSQQILDPGIVEAYKSKKITSSEVGAILNLDRFKVEEFLKQKGVCLHYDINDFWSDIQTFKSLKSEEYPAER